MGLYKHHTAHAAALILLSAEHILSFPPGRF